MKCINKNKDDIIIFYKLNQHDTFLFNDEVCMKTSFKESDKYLGRDYVVGVNLTTGRLIYQSDFGDESNWYKRQVKKIDVQCVY